MMSQKYHSIFPENTPPVSKIRVFLPRRSKASAECEKRGNDLKKPFANAGKARVRCQKAPDASFGKSKRIGTIRRNYAIPRESNARPRYPTRGASHTNPRFILLSTPQDVKYFLNICKRPAPHALTPRP
ncbi:MAG: hypothetical protein ACI4V3_10210 [Faecousia sp.]